MAKSVERVKIEALKGPHVKAVLLAQAVLEKHAEDIWVLDVRKLSTVTDYFVIGTVGSVRQLKAVSEHLDAVLAQRRERVWHVEGATRTNTLHHEPQWALLDCGDVVVHLMDARARSLYQLERLWGDAPRVPVSGANAPR